MKMQILVVDDDPLYIDLVQDVVSQFGHTIIGAENGAAALEALRSRDVQFIISDIEMPVMGGIEFYENVRAIARHKETPFVFLSGTTRADLLEAVAALPDVRLMGKSKLVADLTALFEELGRRR